jgi:hypothetical protein
MIERTTTAKKHVLLFYQLIFPQEKKKDRVPSTTLKAGSYNIEKSGCCQDFDQRCRQAADWARWVIALKCKHLSIDVVVTKNSAATTTS